MRVLVTGFEPFGGEKINASWKAVEQLPDKLGRLSLTKRQIPVVAYECVDRVIELADQHQVDLILCVGEAGGAKKIRVELIGTNWLNMSIPDNGGKQYRKHIAYPGKSDAHFASIPAADIAEKLSPSLPIELSLSAGDYICNNIFYGVREFQSRPMGFIHVPTTEEQGGSNPMDTKQAVECLRSILMELDA